MQTELKWPPSGRDFLVYQRVVVEMTSTRQAARELSLSQTRVRQIVQRVAEWLMNELPVATEATDAAQLRLGQCMAADRVELLLSEAMNGWRVSHETKYFSMALRALTLQSKLPAIAGKLEAIMADALEGPLENAVETPSAEIEELATLGKEPLASVAPPVRDCSPIVKKAPSAPTPASPPPTATPTQTTTSAELPADLRSARRAFFGPAQQPLEDAADEPLTQLTITPNKPGLRLERKLTRRERRRLAKMGA